MRSRWRSTGLLVLALLSASVPCAGGEVEQLAAFTAGDPPPCHDSHPQISTQAGGSFLLLWQEGSCSPSFVPLNFARRYDAAGRPIGPKVELWWGTDLSAAALPDGGFVAVSAAEKDLGGPPPLLATGIGLHRLDAWGRPTGPPFPLAIDPFPSTANFSPRVAVAPDGGVAVVWATFPSFDPGTVSEVHGRFFDASLAPLGEEIRLAPELPGSGQALPDIAFRDDGSALAVWALATAVDPTTSQIFGRRMSARGEPLTAIQRLSTPEPGRQQLDARVVARTDRGAWVGWNSYGPLGSDVQAHVVRLGRGLRPVSPEQTLGLPQSRSARITIGTDGRDNLLALGVGSDFSIAGRLFERSGLPSSSPFVLAANPPLGFLDPTIALQSTGAYLAAWSGGPFDGISGFDLFGALLSPPCLAGHDAACLGPDGRYAVEVSWRKGEESGVAKPLPLSPHAATFGLTNLGGHDVAVLLSGPPGNDLTFTATTGAEIQIQLTDKVTGATRRFIKPAGRFASRNVPAALSALENPPHGEEEAGLGTAGATPAEAFASPGARSTAAPAGGVSCLPSNHTLCLLGGRFRAELETAGIAPQAGLALLRTDRSGIFGLAAEPDSPVTTLSIVDGTLSNGKFWVYLGGLSRAGYRVKITDLSTGVAKTYSNPDGKLESRADRTAF